MSDTPETDKAWREARCSLDRLATIADEAFGPFPVQSAEENLTAIETGIHQLRRDNDKLERQRDEARADCERLNRLLRAETAPGQGEIDHWAALERERDQWKAESLEQAKLLAISADREEKLRTALQRISECDMRWSKKVAREALQ